MLKKKSGDSWVALSVIACSIVLLIALALGLSGATFVHDARRVRVRFPDVTGIIVSSRVKYAGAPAGTVSALRILGASERKEASPNLVEVTLLLHPDVLPLSKDVQISIAADTLLSDKFILINGGSSAAPLAGPDDIFQGLSPTTFDQLARDADDAINGLRRIVAGGEPAGARDLIGRLQKILGVAESALAEIKPVIGNASGLVSEARTAIGDARTTLSGAGPAITDARAAAADVRSILADNKARISRAVEKIDSTATAFASLAKRGESLLRDNQTGISRTLADFRVTADNLKVTSAYSRFLLRDLAAHPNRLLWGSNTKPPVPSEDQLLEKSR